jgi:hypothetical protein
MLLDPSKASAHLGATRVSRVPHYRQTAQLVPDSISAAFADVFEHHAEAKLRVAESAGRRRRRLFRKTAP